VTAQPPVIARVPSVGDDGLYRIPVDQDHVVEPPVWGDRPRSRNWLAILDEDPQSPNGVRRVFCTRGRARFCFSVVRILPRDLIEFGADYLSAGGHRYRDRWYAIVVEVRPHELVVRHFTDLPSLLATAYRERMAERALGGA